MLELMTFIRHGHTNGDGETNEPLNNFGREAVMALYSTPALRPDRRYEGVVFCSMYERSMETARLLRSPRSPLVSLPQLDRGNDAEKEELKSLARFLIAMTDFLNRKVALVVGHGHYPGRLAEIASELVTGHDINHTLKMAPPAGGYMVNMQTGEVTPIP